MGLFKKNKDKEELKENKDTEEVEPIGWNAIEEEFLRIYPNQTNPKHFAPILPMMFGGEDALNGVSIYDGGDFWHFVSFGLTELYDKATDDLEYSGFGYELTFKLKKDNYEDEEAELKNIYGILQMIAGLTFKKGEIFYPNEFIYTGQTVGFDAKQKSNLTGFICIEDPSVNTIDTPNGKVEFLELVGMTDAELKSLSDKASVIEIYKRLGSDITDYHRESIV